MASIENTGIKYIVKVHVGNEEYIHFNVISQPWKPELILVALEEGHTLEDPIEYVESKWVPY